jgi:polysaccharide biosynthesis/export protein
MRLPTILQAPAPLRSGRAAALGLALALAACDLPPLPPEALEPPATVAPFAATQALKEFDAVPDKSYRLGEGDVLTVLVWDRPDLSGQQTVGPDGVITLPVAGSIRIVGLTREEAAAAAKTALSKFYADVSVTIRVDSYVSNRVFVLGRVRNPGAHQFTAAPTLLEALSRAGGVAQDPTASLSHCAVIRGRDRMAWIDLRRLLESGDLTLNLGLKPNDVILIPEWEDQPVYVLGQVARPGVQRWMPGMTFLDVVARAGGTTSDAQPSAVQVVRPSSDLRFTVSLSNLVAGDNGQNIFVRKGDIIYVPTNLMADIGYVVQKIQPFSWVFLARSLQ